MSEGDVLRLKAAMLVLWPHATLPDLEHDHAARFTWARFLGTVTLEDALAVLERHKGDAFPPTVGQIVAVYDPAPTYEQAMADFERLSRSYGTQYALPPAHEFSHPAIAAWARSGAYQAWGVGPDRAELPTAFGVDDSNRRKDFVAYQSRRETERLRELHTAPQTREIVDRVAAQIEAP